MKYNNKSIIGQIVAQDYRTASVFKRFGIDFCCQGNRTIEDACLNKGIAISDTLKALELIIGIEEKKVTDFDSWPLDLLADYIEKKHHRFVEIKSLEIKPYLNKICKVHGNVHSELLTIKSEFDASVGELTMHMKREELLLFPYIRKLSLAKTNNGELPKAVFGSIKNPIDQMEAEHSVEGERFSKINTLSNNYSVPDDGCNTYKVTYALLKEFEDDLHHHIHLENNILFPKAFELEKSLYNGL